MYRNVLVPVLFDEGHDPSDAFAVAQLLADDGATITLVHVIEEVPGYAALAISGDVLARSFQSADVALTEAAKALPGAETKLLRGHAGPAILEFARTNDVDCIVMRSHKPGLENWLIGSTADRVVRHAKCCVHVIR